MALLNSTIGLVILILIAFIPCIYYIVKIRNSERYYREPWGPVAGIFIWGAIIATFTAVILSMFFIGLSSGLMREYEYLAADPGVQTLFIVCIIAPFVEEFTKGVGIYFVKRRLTEVEDGLIYGAASGLGFAATENLLYETSALAESGLAAFIIVAFIRTISSALLHASATAMTGYGISKKINLGRTYHIIPFYLLAVAMHGIFNLFASFSIIGEWLGLDVALPVLGLFLAIFFAGGSYRFIKGKIRDLDSGRHAV
jgi:RsiW-degrading membrane proteinase PrsW (M82 family)